MLQKQMKSVGLMDIYYMVGVTAIPHLGFGKLINSVSKEDIACHVTSGDQLHCTCSDFVGILFESLEKKRK